MNLQGTPDSIVLEFVNGKITNGAFFRWMNEIDWMIEGDALPLGAIMPRISDVGGVGSVRVFTSEAACQTYMDKQPEGSPLRPFKKDKGCDLFAV